MKKIPTIIGLAAIVAAPMTAMSSITAHAADPTMGRIPTFSSTCEHTTINTGVANFIVSGSVADISRVTVQTLDTAGNHVMTRVGNSSRFTFTGLGNHSVLSYTVTYKNGTQTAMSESVGKHGSGNSCQSAANYPFVITSVCGTNNDIVRGPNGLYLVKNSKGQLTWSSKRPASGTGFVNGKLTLTNYSATDYMGRKLWFKVGNTMTTHVKAVFADTGKCGVETVKTSAKPATTVWVPVHVNGMDLYSPKVIPAVPASIKTVYNAAPDAVLTVM